MMLLRVLLITLLLAFSVEAKESVKIGVLAKRGYHITMEKWASTADYLNKEIDGHHFEVIPLSFEQLRYSVEKDEIDFVLTNTMYYVELEYLYGVSRIATLKNISSDGEVHTSFGGVIFTRADSNIDNYNDLQNRSFAAVNIDSFGGWVMGQKELSDAGYGIDWFSEFSYLGSHDAVVLAVQAGKVDAGTVRSDTLERMDNEGIIKLDEFKILEPKEYENFGFSVSTKLYPEWPFAKLSSTSQELSEQVLSALLDMRPECEAAQSAHIAGWTIPLDYSDVHTMLEELQVGPYKELGKLTFARFYEKYKGTFFFVILGFLVVLGILLYIYWLNNQLKEKQEYIKHINEGLEQKVEQRTSELNKMYSHEKYLKDILRTIADINELLITSYSTQSVLHNAMDRLIQHKEYRFVWIGLIKDNELEVIGQSDENDTILDKQHYVLNNGEENFAFRSAKSAIELNTTIIEKLPQEYISEIQQNGYCCLSSWLIAIPLRSSEEHDVLGVLSVFSERENGFEAEEIKILENLATDIGLALHSIHQRSLLDTMELEKISNYEETILAFVNIIEQRDSYTAGHTIRVAEYCRMLAEHLGVEESEIVKLEQAAILHDIGKVVTPDSILLKPGNLTALEYDLIKEHSNAGYRMLSKIEMYKDLAEIIRYHHVHYDGNGYPKLAENKLATIPFLSHIMVVADAFDAMTTNRIYRPRKSVEEALLEIELFSGTQFHPKVADAALEVLRDITVAKTSQLPKNELEQRRFAYFFMDSLTDIYNEDYLQTLLIQREDDHRCLYLLELSQFTHYNKTYGWDAGNKFLKGLAAELQEKYQDAMVFRYHGDDFILLFNEHREILQEDIDKLQMLQESFVRVSVKQFDFSGVIPKL